MTVRRRGGTRINWTAYLFLNKERRYMKAIVLIVLIDVSSVVFDESFTLKLKSALTPVSRTHTTHNLL